jgi:hypothetical protein
MQAEWSKPAAMFLTYKSIRTVAMRQWLMMEMNFHSRDDIINQQLKSYL